MPNPRDHIDDPDEPEVDAEVIADLDDTAADEVQGGAAVPSTLGCLTRYCD